MTFKVNMIITSCTCINPPCKIPNVTCHFVSVCPKLSELFRYRVTPTLNRPTRVNRHTCRSGHHLGAPTVPQCEHRRVLRGGGGLPCSMLLLLLSCLFNHHDVKLKYDIRSAFLYNSKWEIFQMEDLCI